MLPVRLVSPVTVANIRHRLVFVCHGDACSLVVFELERPHIDPFEGHVYRTVSLSNINPAILSAFITVR